MDHRFRVLLGTIASIQFLVGLLFLLDVPLATDLWPFPGTTEMSSIFIASIFWAAAAPVGWCLLVRSDRAFTGVFLDYLAIMLPLGFLALTVGVSDANVGFMAFGAFAFVTALFSVWVMRWSLRHSWRSDLPTPRPVLAAFSAFCVTLGIVGVLLVAQTPGILPWAVTPTLSTAYGLMFLGAAVYFAYGLVHRRWENAGGQLAGFLAYDIVLIVPFVARIVNGTPSYYGPASEPFRLNLVLYTAIVVGSALISAYYLFVLKETRIWPRPSLVAQDESQPQRASARSA